MALQQFVSNASSWAQYLKENHPKKSAFAAFIALYILYNKIKRAQKKSVDNKVVLITGGGSGLGKNMARRFSALGARVVLWDINEKGLAAVGKQIAAEGGMCWTYVCDVTDRQAVYRVAERVHREVGKVDIVINNAGIVSGDFITEVPDHRIELTFKVNVISHFWIIKAFLPEMIRFNSGHIVTIASAAGLRGAPKLTDYCASKGAAVLLDESLRVEFARRGLDGIKTTCVCPYFINTGMFDGAKTRFSFLLPILSEDYASTEIINAILTDEPVLQMPALISTSSLLRALFPVRACDWISDFLGISSSMDHFVGRPQIAAPPASGASGATASQN